MHAAGNLRASAVWKYFAKIERDGHPLSQCKLCFAELSGHRAGNAKKHLRTLHDPELLDELEAEDGGSSRIVSHQLLKEIETLNEKRLILVNEIRALAARKPLRNCSVLPSKAPPPRAPRSDHLDKEKHRENNKRATQLWRERLAYRSLLQQQIEDLPKVKRTVAAAFCNFEQCDAQAQPRQGWAENVCFAQPSGTHSAHTAAHIGSTENRFVSEVAMLELAVDISHQVTLIAGEVYVAKNKQYGGTILFDHRVRPKHDRLLDSILRLSGEEQLSSAYSYGTLERLLESKRAHQSLLLSFFSGDAPTFEPRISAFEVDALNPADRQKTHANDACHDFLHASLLSQLTGLPVIVISNDTDTVKFVHEELLIEDIAFKDLSSRLLGSVQGTHDLRAASSPSSLMLTQLEQFITTRCEVKIFNPALHLDWYMDYYVETQMQLWNCTRLRDTMEFITRWARLAKWSGQCRFDPQDTNTSPDDVVLPTDQTVLHYLRQNAEIDLNHIHTGRRIGFIFEYGSQRLGGIFLRLHYKRKTIAIGHTFIRLDLLRSTFMLRFLAGLIKAQSYDRWFDQVECFVPDHLSKFLEPIITAVDAVPKDPRLQRWPFPEYTWPTANLFRLLE